MPYVRIYIHKCINAYIRHPYKRSSIHKYRIINEHAWIRAYACTHTRMYAAMHAIFRHTLICAIHYLHAFVGLWACVEEFGSVHTHTDIKIIHLYMCVNKHVCPRQVVSAYVLRDLTKAAENVVGRVGRAYLRVPSRVRQDYLASCRQNNSAKICSSMCENMRKRVEQIHRSQLSAEPALPFLNKKCWRAILFESADSSWNVFFQMSFANWGERGRT